MNFGLSNSIILTKIQLATKLFLKSMDELQIVQLHNFHKIVDFCIALGSLYGSMETKLKRSITFHPQTNGQFEVVNQMIVQILKAEQPQYVSIPVVVVCPYHYVYLCHGLRWPRNNRKKNCKSMDELWIVQLYNFDKDAIGIWIVQFYNFHKIVNFCIALGSVYGSMDTKLKRSIAFHPQINGQFEVVNQMIVHLLDAEQPPTSDDVG